MKPIATYRMTKKEFGAMCDRYDVIVEIYGPELGIARRADTGEEMARSTTNPRLYSTWNDVRGCCFNGDFYSAHQIHAAFFAQKVLTHTCEPKPGKPSKGRNDYSERAGGGYRRCSWGICEDFHADG